MILNSGNLEYQKFLRSIEFKNVTDFDLFRLFFLLA